MAQVLIRNLDEAVVAKLRHQAEGAGLSLEAFLRVALARQAGANRAEIVSDIETLRKTVGPPKPGEPLADEIVRNMRQERARRQSETHDLNDR